MPTLPHKGLVEGVELVEVEPFRLGVTSQHTYWHGLPMIAREFLRSRHVPQQDFEFSPQCPTMRSMSTKSQEMPAVPFPNFLVEKYLIAVTVLFQTWLLCT